MEELRYARHAAPPSPSVNSHASEQSASLAQVPPAPDAGADPDASNANDHDDDENDPLPVAGEPECGGRVNYGGTTRRCYHARSILTMSRLLGCSCFRWNRPTLGLPSWIRYLGVYPATAGFFTCVTLIITWTLNNQPSEGRKGTGMAILNVIGQMGPLLGTRLYPKSDGPYYVKGMVVCAVFMGFVGMLAVGLRFVLGRANRHG